MVRETIPQRTQSLQTVNQINLEVQIKKAHHVQREGLKTTARVELTNVIFAIKVIYHIRLCTLINKQKHSATESKTPKQIIQSSKRGRPPKNEKVNPSTEKYFETDDKKPGDSPAEYLENYKEALEEFKINKVILDNKLFGMQLEAAENPLLRVLEKFNKLTLKNIESKDAQIKEKIEN